VPAWRGPVTGSLRSCGGPSGPRRLPNFVLRPAGFPFRATTGQPIAHADSRSPQLGHPSGLLPLTPPTETPQAADTLVNRNGEVFSQVHGRPGEAPTGTHAKPR
jgi:hypothetical protein